jgi:eukaryotic-like serine/threonine-protein kinase
VLSQKAGLGDHVKILDFGLARLTQHPDASNLTTGVVVGTPAYMAPEQIRGTTIDQRTDLYACGVLLVELLTGKKPFVSAKDDPVEVCTMHLKQPPPRLAELVPGVEFGELEAVVARALAKQPDDRYATAEEFAAALDVVVPRMRTATPIAGTAVASGPVATPSGWAVPGGASPEPEPELPGPRPIVTPAGLPPGFDLSSAIPSGEAPHAPAEPSAAELVDLKATVAFQGAPPAGPSPLQVPDAAPLPEPASLPPAPPTSTLPFTHRQLAFAGGGVLVLVVVIAIIASAAGGGSTPKAAHKNDARTSEQSELTTPSDAAQEQIDRAHDMIAAGQREDALQLLLAARKVFPDDARVAYHAGKVYFDKKWWNVGLRHLRETVRLDPGFRNDPELIKLVLRAFIVERDYHAELASFLRKDIGEPARPYLEETAQTHPSSQVRARAATELKKL